MISRDIPDGAARQAVAKKRKRQPCRQPRSAHYIRSGGSGWLKK
jgi:hypothetical protein